MDIMLAIDGGGSRTRCYAITRDGDLLGAGESGASNHLLVGIDLARASLDEAICAALHGAQLDARDDLPISVGLAGVDYDGCGAEEMSQVFRDLGFSQAVVNGDMVIAHAGALGGEPGVVALSGTGSAILGIGADGARVKVGGWGPIFGDEGSAYRIAQHALIAAARAYDGRGPQTELLPALVRALGLSEFTETVACIYTGRMEAREIAALSPVVHQTAEAGDRVARDIFLRAGEDLAEGVVAALSRLDLERRMVSYQGSVLTHCAIARERFSERLRQQLADVSVVSPRYAPVIGAYLLGCKALGWSFPVERDESLRRIER